MSAPGQRDLEQILAGLDEIMEVAYFVPLSVGDALAVQFGVEALRGLPVETVAAVFDLMDRVQLAPDAEGRPSLGAAAGRFFEGLREEHPEVFKLWSEAEREVVLDPEGAFRSILARARTRVEAWLAAWPEAADPSLSARVVDQAVGGLIQRLNPARWADDAAWRRFLKEEALKAYPLWARPAIYLEAWAEYVRAVLDLSPRPETRAGWPY